MTAIPGDMKVWVVPAPAAAPIVLDDGPMRTAGRPFFPPAPPGELHVAWAGFRSARRWWALLPAAIIVIAFVDEGVRGPALLVVLPVLYAAAVAALNRRVLVVSGRRLAFRHGPLPWFGSRPIDARAIDGVLVFAATAQAAGLPTQFDVAVRTGERLHRLVRQAPAAHAYALQQLLVEHLRIEVPADLVPDPVGPGDLFGDDGDDLDLDDDDLELDDPYRWN